jgi:hypothetical protein
MLQQGRGEARTDPEIRGKLALVGVSTTGVDDLAAKVF